MQTKKDDRVAVDSEVTLSDTVRDKTNEWTNQAEMILTCGGAPPANKNAWTRF